MIIMTSQIFAGSIYYVDATGGDDLNDGLSPETAWKTVAKVNAQSFSPGDFILFKRGEIWAETPLLIHESGSSGNPITFSAYGSGAKPIISLRGPRPGWNNPGNWIDNGGNVWYMSCGADLRRLWLDGTEYLRSQTLGGVNSTTRFYHNGSNLYVYATSNPASFYSNIESAFTKGDVNTVESALVDYITIEDLDIRAGYKTMALSGISNWIIDNCDIGLDTSRIGIEISKNGSTPSSHIEIKNCTVESGYNFTYDWEQIALDDGIRFIYEVNNSKIHHCTVSNWGHTCVLLDAGSTGDINNNEIYNNIIESPNTSYCRGISTQGTDNLCINNKFYRNLIRNTTVRSQLNGNLNEFYYNIFCHVRNSSVYAPEHDTGQAVSFEGYSGFVCKDNKFYNNIIYDTDGAGIKVWHNPVYETKTGNEIINNIIIDAGKNSNTGDNNIGIHVGNGDTVGANIYKNNLIYKYGITNVVLYRGTAKSVISWNNDNGDNGNIIQDNIQYDPLFVESAIGNFYLQSASPCIDAGTDVGLTEDYAGNPVPYWYGVDIGAYEYVGENPLLNANADASPTSGETSLTVNFTGDATGGTSPYSYSWDFGDGQSSTQQNPSHTFNSSGNYTVTLTVTDSNNDQDSDSLIITVTDPVPSLIASNSGSPTSGDYPLTVNFTGNATGGVSPYNYNWDFGDGGSSNQQNPSHTYNSAGNYTATLMVTDSASNQDSDSLTITVTTPPPPPLVASCIASPTSGDVPFTQELPQGAFLPILTAGISGTVCLPLNKIPLIYIMPQEITLLLSS
jgi:PKD repeat protein